jgi:hypothetical protein
MPTSSPLSINSCCTRRRLPAPIEMRKAISRSLAAERATRRLATFDPAISSTRLATIARIHSGRSKALRISEGPLAADRTLICLRKSRG